MKISNLKWRISKIFKSVLVVFLLLLVTIIVISKLSISPHSDFRLNVIAFYANLHAFLKNNSSSLSFIYKENWNKVKLEKNLYYTTNLNYKYYDNIDLSYIPLLVKTKLIKRWKNCYIYRLKVKDILEKYRYDFLPKSYSMFNNYIKWNYNSWKKCEEWDYENCNIYITERWMLNYNDRYDCK